MTLLFSQIDMFVSVCTRVFFIMRITMLSFENNDKIFVASMHFLIFDQVRKGVELLPCERES